MTGLPWPASRGFAQAPGSPFAAGTNPASVAVGNFNGDGDLDLAVLLGEGGGDARDGGEAREDGPGDRCDGGAGNADTPADCETTTCVP